MPWEKITLVGVGLLGGSLGLAIKNAALAKRVTGYVRRPESAQECDRLGLVDETTCDLAAAVSGADLVVLCTPLGQMKSLAEAMAPNLKKGAVITDVGSVKTPVCKELTPIFHKASAEFVGSHPMAGAEKSGPSSARRGLFENSICLVTPTRTSKQTTVEAVEDFWRSAGCKTLRMSPELHDEFVGRSSHLPHVIAAELANYVLSPTHAPEQGMVCATGFRDTTRIASGSPEMWRDISLANRTNLLRVLGVFIEGLQEFQFALEQQDEKGILEFFQTAKRRRDQWRQDEAVKKPA